MESFRLIQCYHCLSFDHIKTNCPHKDERRTCARCGGSDHQVRNCGNQTVCLHCKGPHPATARCCPKYQQLFQTKFNEVTEQIKEQLLNPAHQHQYPTISLTPINKSEYEESWTKIQEVALGAESSKDFVEALYTLAKSSTRPDSKVSCSTYDIESVVSDEDRYLDTEDETPVIDSAPQPPANSASVAADLPARPPPTASEDIIKEYNKPRVQNFQFKKLQVQKHPVQKLPVQDHWTVKEVVMENGTLVSEADAKASLCDPKNFICTRDKYPGVSEEVIISFGYLAPEKVYYLYLFSNDKTCFDKFLKIPIKLGTNVELLPGSIIIWDEIYKGWIRLKCKNEYISYANNAVTDKELLKSVFNHIQLLISKARS